MSIQHIALRGDCTFAGANESIRTSILKEATILSAWHKTNKISVLVHIDKYTEIIDVLQKLALFLKDSKIEWDDPNLRIRGYYCRDAFLKQAATIGRILSLVKTNFFLTPLPKDASFQIELHSMNGEFSLHRGDQIDLALEKVQDAKWEKWENLLKENQIRLKEVDVESFGIRTKDKQNKFGRNGIPKKLQCQLHSELFKLLGIKEEKDPPRVLNYWDKKANLVSKD